MQLSKGLTWLACNTSRKTIEQTTEQYPTLKTIADATKLKQLQAYES